jgi:hypothetical protein
MKQLIKFIFVIVMPVSMLIFTVGTFVSTDYSATSKLMLVIFTLFTILQSLMWIVYMNKIKMVPKTSREFYYGFGLAFGFKDKQAFLTLPFVVFSFDWRTRVKKEENYGYYY